MLGIAACVTSAAQAGRRCRLSTQIAQAAATSHALNILVTALMLRNDAEAGLTASRYNAGGCRLSTNRQKLQLQTQTPPALVRPALKDGRGDE